MTHCAGYRAAAVASADGPVAWSRLLFSAKECVHKAWYPLMREELGVRGGRPTDTR
ncbi:hypothetical protein [Streptomyces sp. NPDC053431]|uniref:hypothetical protein n=1 Tax=Streptomyces sp. NPDC053431 TaxID=3365703 RepID=UPI0037D5E994